MGVLNVASYPCAKTSLGDKEQAPQLEPKAHTHMHESKLNRKETQTWSNGL